MSRLIVLAFALAVLATPARADFAAGVAAFKAGDYATAIAEWLPLARNGNAAAQHNLGVMFNNGLGTEKDPVQAASWFGMAAEQGHRDAQAKLGYLYARGEGVAQAYDEAVRWFREAAEQGHSEAQYNLGMMYALGNGIGPDRVQGLMWLTLAAAGGLEQARTRRDELAAAMLPSEVEEAELLAEALGPGGGAAAPEPKTEEKAPLTSVSSTLAAARATVAGDSPAAAEPAAGDGAPEPPSASPGDGAGVVIRLATYESRDAAAEGWDRLNRLHGDVLGGLGHSVVAEDGAGGGDPYFRLELGPVDGRDRAERVCGELKDRNLYCAVAF